MPLLSLALFISLDKVNNIVKILDIIPPIPFWAVSSPVYKVFDSEAPTFFNYAFIEKMLYFERFVVVGVTFHKHKGEMLWTRALKRIFGRTWSWLKLTYRENRVDPSVILYIQHVGKATNSLNDPKGANILLGQLLYHFDGGRN